LARFRTISALPEPVDDVGLVHFISSPVMAASRFWSVPSQFGKLLPTMCSETDLSASLTV
jgi:hypothetical protein